MQSAGEINGAGNAARCHSALRLGQSGGESEKNIIITFSLQIVLARILK